MLAPFVSSPISASYDGRFRLHILVTQVLETERMRHQLLAYQRHNDVTPIRSEIRYDINMNKNGCFLLPSFDGAGARNLNHNFFGVRNAFMIIFVMRVCVCVCVCVRARARGVGWMRVC